MNNDEGDDLIVSFAIECPEPADIKSLILLRTPKFEFILDEDERGVSVSHDDEPEVPDQLRYTRTFSDLHSRTEN